MVSDNWSKSTASTEQSDDSNRPAKDQINSWSNWAGFEKRLGSLQFAVVIITIFILFMIAGTLIESYQGTEFANRMIYKRWYFMLTQFFIFISVLYAMFLRLPFKKRLAGFYAIHIGLITVGAGSVMTYVAGIDGQVTLLPNNPTRELVLTNDVVTISYPENGDTVVYKLPYKAGPVEINESYKDVNLQTFLPFQQKILNWKEPKNSDDAGYPSTQYKIANPNVSQELIFSLSPAAMEFPSTANLGPLSVHYFPNELAPCFGKVGESRILIWDSKSKECFTPEEQKISIQKTNTGKRFFAVKKDNQFNSFFPDFSPFPLNKDLNIAKDSTLRALSLKMFEEKRHLFLMGPALAYFNDDKWTVAKIEPGHTADLPWMGFEVEVLYHSVEKIPVYTPEYVYPIQKNGELIKGQEKAVSVKIGDNNYWVTTDAPLKTVYKNKSIVIQLVKETLQLPFELVLSNFKMDMDPGTNRPASYESFVKLFTGDDIRTHHIYMNNPLKHKNLTFYQASYFPLEQNDGYGSVLSVNLDPGRGIKYFGSLLVVLGAIWHFSLKNRKQNKTAKS